MNMRNLILACALAMPAVAAAPVQQMSCVPGPQTVYFDLRSAKLRPDATPVLEEAVRSATRCGRMMATVRGYADATEAPIIASMRAAEAAKYLKKNDVLLYVVPAGHYPPRVPHIIGAPEPENRSVVISYEPRG
jgi:outer membrane protein OmpA-like peptidoglycan-associated protein